MMSMFNMLKKDKNQEVELTISTKTVLRVVFVVFAAIIFLAAVQKAMFAVILIFTAFFLTLALDGPVSWIAKRLPGTFRDSRAMATGVTFVIFLLLVSSFLASVVPPLVKQTESFISAVPRLVEDSRNQDSEIGGFIRQYRLEGQIESASAELGTRLQNIGGSAIEGASRIGSSVFAVLTILALTFMMLLEGPKFVQFGRELLPAGRRRDIERVAPKMYQVVRGYINGQVTLAAIAAAVILPAFLVLGIGYPIALMAIVFICGLIPMVGHFIGATIVTLVALTTSPAAALIILAYYILYQQIENYIVQPRVQANTTNMSPLQVFASVVVGVSFGGLFGGLFAIPLAGCLRVLILDYLTKHDYIDGNPVVEEEAIKASAK